MIQRKITDNLGKLPISEREKFLREQERQRKIELKEMKENLWKNWRGKTAKNYSTTKEMEDEGGKLDELWKKVEEWKVEQEKIVEPKMKEKEEKMTEKKRKAEEKTRRLCLKEKLEGNWEMVRWLTSYIEENRESWERNWESPNLSTPDTTQGSQPLVHPKTEFKTEMLQESSGKYSPPELQPSLVEQNCDKNKKKSSLTTTQCHPNLLSTVEMKKSETHYKGEGGAFACPDLEKISTRDPQSGRVCLKKFDSYEIGQDKCRLQPSKTDYGLETRDENLGLLVRKKIKELTTKPTSPRNGLRNLNHLKPRSPKLGTKQRKISGRPEKLDQRLQENYVQKIIKKFEPKNDFFSGETSSGNHNAIFKSNTNLILAAKQGLSHTSPGQRYDWSRGSHVTVSKPMGDDQPNEPTEM